VYHIRVESQHAAKDSGIRLTLDGNLLNSETLLLSDDGGEHIVQVKLN
jgi:hypothetical protein